MARAAAEPKPYLAPHERPSGPWAEHELEDGAHHLNRAEHIIKNKKFLHAIKRHSEKKARENHAMAHKAGMLAKMGKISPRALKKLED